MPATAARPRVFPKPTLVLFVRHAVTATTGKVLPGRAPGLHLSGEGERQAEAVAKRIAGVPGVKAVYASPLERARETAAPIAAACGLRVTTDAGLLECDFGEWTGARLNALARRPEWSIVQRHPSGFRFPGGESFVEMQARVTAAVQAVVARHPGGTIVVVSHADPIKVAVATALGTHLDLFQRLSIATASVTAVAYHAHGPVVVTVNSVDGDLAWLGKR
jgi:probable phosphomutase (TIGR03848 family)